MEKETRNVLLRFPL